MQQLGNHLEIAIEKLRSNMLEHPNRDNPIIVLLALSRRRRRPVVTQQDTHLSVLIQPGFFHPLLSQLLLLFGKRHARHTTARGLRRGDGQVAPAAADIK